MSDIAKLTVALYANSAQFVSELQKSKKKTQDWKKDVSRSYNAVKTVGAVAATAMAASLALVYNQQSQLIDQTAKFSDRIGISTEALTQFHHASELTGVGEKKLNMALQRMTRRIGEAAQGSGEAAPALKELGLNAQALGRMTPDQQLYALADAFTTVESQSERVRLAFKLFDSEGVAMVNMLAGGATGLRAMADEADALGITLSRVDAAKVEMANDAMFRVDQTSKAFGQHLTTELAPIIAGLAEEFTNVAKEHGGMSQFIGDGLEYMVTGVGFVADAFHGWKLIFAGLDAAWQNLQLGVMVGVQGIVDLLHKVGGTIFEVVISPLQVTLDLAGKMSDEAKEMAESLRSLTNVPPPQLFSEGAIEKQEAKLFASIDHIRTVASQPLPSDSIENWYRTNREKYQKLAEEYAAGINRNDPQALPAPESDPESDPAADTAAVTAFRKETEQIQAEWTRRQQLMADLKNKSIFEEQWRYEDQKIALAEQFQAAYEQAALNQQLQTQLETEYFESRQSLWGTHQSRLTEIQKAEEDKRAKERQAVAQSTLSFMSQNLSITTGMLKESGKEQSGIYRLMFAAQKAAAIPGMIVATEDAAVKALTLGPIIGPIASGAVRAMGYASIGIAAGQAIAGARASGGHVAPNGLYEVNERGPEVVTVGSKDYLMVGNQSGRVTPNSALSAGGGAGRGDITIIMNNNGAPVRASGSWLDDKTLQVILDAVDGDQAERTLNGTGQAAQASEIRYGHNRGNGVPYG